MSGEPEPRFVVEPSPDHPGWLSMRVNRPDLFNSTVIGTMAGRIEGHAARIRCFPRPELRNVMGAIHGGAILGFADVAMSAGARLLTDMHSVSGLTLDLSTQFISPGRIDLPLDAVVEVLRETGRLIFLRGLLEQDGTVVAAFNGTMRKPSQHA